MEPWWPERPFALTEVARTGEHFADFAPYVPAIDPAGRVVFQAAWRAGGSGIFAAQDGRIVPLATAPNSNLAAFTSHPDLKSGGEGCVYAETREGGTVLVRFAQDGRTTVVEGGRLAVGPLGPTINEAGVVAFRGTTVSAAAVWASEGDTVRPIAETGARFAGFRGLPIATRTQIVFLADLVGGGQELCAHAPASGIVVLADTRGEFAGFGNFPAANETGVVAFAAQRRRGGGGIFVLGASGEAREVVGDSAFESYRGALIDEAGRVVFFATPAGGALGIYRGPDPQEHRVLGVGDACAGSTVAEFALNPVSINAAGHFAVRVRLADGRGLVLRAAPV
jgi:hypothetical protein